MNREDVVTFYVNTNSKRRKITTYANNSSGQNLKKKHIEFINKYANVVDFKYSFSYIQNKNTKKLMQKHINSKYFLKVDIKNFFNSINHQLLVTKIITELKIDSDKAYEIIAESSIDNGLEIGLITSPLLSNIYMNDFDSKLSKLLSKNTIYTRYSDDILISSNQQINYHQLLKTIELELEKLELKINEDKVFYKELVNKADYIKFLGLNIIKGKYSNYLTVSRKFKKEAVNTKEWTSKNARLNYIKYNEIFNDKML